MSSPDPVARLEPVHAPPMNPLPARPSAVIWPALPDEGGAATMETRWPALPDAESVRDSQLERERAMQHARRLKREQRGESWNA